MKKIASILVLVLMVSFAEAANVAVVDKPDGSVVIVRPCNGKKVDDVIEKTLKQIGLERVPYIIIDESKLPDRADRDYWETKNGKIQVNATKKANKAAEKQQKKDVLKQKLGLSDDELKALRGE